MSPRNSNMKVAVRTSGSKASPKVTKRLSDKAPKFPGMLDLNAGFLSGGPSSSSAIPSSKRALSANVGEVSESDVIQPKSIISEKQAMVDEIYSIELSTKEKTDLATEENARIKSKKGELFLQRAIGRKLSGELCVKL
jgi:hypothetical protein